VKIRRPGSKNEEVISAYINSGFRAGEPTISLPIPLAKLFDVKHATLSEDYIAYGGTFPNVRILGMVEVKVNVPDRETKWIRAKAICVEGEEETLLSRELIGLMRIIPDYETGVWRFKDDPPNVTRNEAQPQYWVEET